LPVVNEVVRVAELNGVHVGVAVGVDRAVQGGPTKVVIEVEAEVTTVRGPPW